MILPMTSWIDTHCHLDAPEFAADIPAVRARASRLGVGRCVVPAVEVANFDAVRALAHRFGDAYALGIHPLCVARAQDQDLVALDEALTRSRADPRLVAVGEIGLDYFVPELREGALRERQEYFYREQLKLARRHGLPVVLHVRRSVDRVLKGLRDIEVPSGIAHAFNGSVQQAQSFIALGCRLGFGGAVTFDRALQLRALARVLPLDSLVLETDSPDIAPHWLYRTAAERADGALQGRNEPGELPAIAAVVADLRGIALQTLADATGENAFLALPGLRGLDALPADNDQGSA
jgi:TatD DNase family protein